MVKERVIKGKTRCRFLGRSEHYTLSDCSLISSKGKNITFSLNPVEISKLYPLRKFLDDYFKTDIASDSFIITETDDCTSMDEIIKNDKYIISISFCHVRMLIKEIKYIINLKSMKNLK